MRWSGKLLFFISLIVFSCRENQKISRDKMVVIFADAMRLEASQQVAYNYLPVSDSIWETNYAYLLKKHDVSQTNFESTVEYYKEHAKEFSDLMADVIAVLDDEDNKDFKR